MTICGEVDISTKGQVRRRLTKLLDDRPNRLIVSLEFVDFLDAAGATVLEEVGRHATTSGTDFVLMSSRSAVERMVHAARIDQRFAVCPSIGHALTGEAATVTSRAKAR